MRIRTRIHVTLGTVLVLHIFTAVMGHVGLNRSQRDLMAIESINEDTIRILSIDKGIAELQRNVSTYMLSGHVSAANQVHGLLDSLRSEIQTARFKTRQGFVASQLEDISARFQSFGENFDKVTTDRQNRAELIHDQMLPTKVRILNDLNEYSQSHSNRDTQSIRDQMYAAENAALLYFESPRREQVTAATRHISNARTLVSEHLGDDSFAEHILELIEEYEQAFLTAVQATQGYLHLVNVVLAGETAELLYQSAQIRAESLNIQDSIEHSMRNGAQRFQRWSDAVATLTVLAGIFTAWFMIRTVLQPILEMTKTLHSLTVGDTAKIEYIGRSDEIGMMADAAEVFRLKNTETEHLLKNAQTLSNDLERRNSEMTQFVYTVSHDLKSPLVTIQGFVGALRHAVANEKPRDEIESMVVRIQKASKRMSLTVDDLLELSRIGMIVNEFREFSFGECCNTVLTDLTSLIREKTPQIEVEGSETIIYADEIRIRQVVQNLIQNALVHGHLPDQSPVITASATVSDGMLELRVTDRGPGIPEEYREKVFGLFQRLSNDKQGTGVGLAIVSKVAEAHSGHAWVEFNQDGSTSFVVTIPQTGTHATSKVAA